YYFYLHSFPTRRSSDLKAKSSNEKSVIVSSSISAFLGITEPALFGVLTKYKRGLLAATIGSALASAFISAFGVRIYGYILSSIRSEEHTSELQSRFDLV